MDETGGEGTEDHPYSRSEGALGDLAQLLVDNPWMKQALQMAFGARERASQAGASAIRNLNHPTRNDDDRLARRLRSVSERLESVEDTLDQVTRELAELRRERDSARSGPSSRS